MSKMEVYDPAMCCSTGICGPAVDPKLVRFAADLDWLNKKGVEVRRYNLSQEPAAFAGNPLVRDKLAAASIACLPLILVDGEEKSSGTYPGRHELAEMAGMAYDPAVDAPPPTQATTGTPLASLPLIQGDKKCC